MNPDLSCQLPVASCQLPGTKSDVEQVIGNAVPVKLAEYVGTRLAAYIQALHEDGALTASGQLFEPRKALRAA